MSHDIIKWKCSNHKVNPKKYALWTYLKTDSILTRPWQYYKNTPTQRVQTTQKSYCSKGFFVETITSLIIILKTTLVNWKILFSVHFLGRYWRWCSVTGTWRQGSVVCFSQIWRHLPYCPSLHIEWYKSHMIRPTPARPHPSLGAANFQPNNLEGHCAVSKVFCKIALHMAAVGHEKTPSQNWWNAHDLQGAIVDALVDLDQPGNSVTYEWDKCLHIRTHLFVTVVL